MEKSDSIKNLAKAIMTFNAEVGKIHKKSTNPFFKSKYASLPDILSEISEPLQSAGLIITQLPDGLSLTTMLIHVESGEYITASGEMKPVKNDPQSLGSAITYQRRYAIGALLSLNIDVDDDGNKATTPPKKQNLTPANKETWSKVVEALKGDYTIAQVEQKYTLSKEFRELLLSESI